MKKLLLILLPVLTLLGIGGGVWWKYGREPNPLAHVQMLVDKGNLQGAAMELRGIVRLSPQNATAHFRLGELELRLNDPVAAEKELKQARDLGFDARRANALLARTYMAQNKYKELLREFSPQGLPPDQASSLLILRSVALLATGDAAAAQTEAAEAERLMPQSVEAPLNSARIALTLHDLNSAEMKAERALAISPRSGEALLLKGQLQNLRGDRMGAIHTFGEAIAAAPNLVAARLERANVLVANNEDAKAREDVEAVLKIAPTNALAVYLKGVLLVRANDYAAADIELTKLGSSISRFPRGYYFLALVKYNLGQAEQAADAASRYLADNPNEPDAIRLAASIEMAGRRYASAVRVLSKALDLGVADANILDLLGQAYSRNGQLGQAVQTLERAAMLALDDVGIRMRLAAARLATGDAAGAVNDLEYALKVAPTQTDAAEALVTAALALGDIDKALFALDQVKKLEGDSEVASNLAGTVKTAQVDLDGASAVLSDTLKRFPQSAPTRINLARVMVLQNKSQDAERLLNEVLEREPTNTAALNVLIPTLEAEGQAQRAVTVMEAAYAADPLSPAMLIGLANALIHTGDTKKALELVDTNLKERGTSTRLLAMQARLRMMLGQPEGARDSYRRILDLDPGNLEARESLVNLLVSVNNIDDAKTVIEEGLRASPGNVALLRAYLQVTLKAQGLDAALATADRLAADPTNRAVGRLLKGATYLLAGRPGDAITAYTAEQRSQPSSALALGIAAARSAAGQPDQAAEELRWWLTTHADDADAAERLAQLDLAARRFSDAKEHLQVVANKRPNDATALNNLAWIYQHSNDPRARSTALRAYLISPTPHTADTLGWILTAEGNPKKGLVLLRQAAAQHGDAPSIRYHLAVALKETGQSPEALGVLQPIVQGSVSFDEKQDAARLLDQLTKPLAVGDPQASVARQDKR